jgi:hypothetical protein
LQAAHKLRSRQRNQRLFTVQRMLGRLPSWS